MRQRIPAVLPKDCNWQRKVAGEAGRWSFYTCTYEEVFKKNSLYQLPEVGDEI